ncbi:cache domain-containing protein [Flavitalea antarctica]
MSVKETANRLTSAVAKLSNRYAPAIITIIILACAFYYYFRVVVTTNETNLKERKFRGLHQVATNIKNKLDTYAEKNAKNFIESVNKPGSIVDTLTLQKEFGLTFHGDKGAAIPNGLEKFRYEPVKKEFEFYPLDTGYASVALNLFIQPLLRRDIFNHYMLADNGSIIYDELNISQQSLHDLISTTLKDDTIAKIEISESGNLVKKSIGGKDYRLFTIAFSSGGKSKFTIGGYITDDQYEAERRYIPPYGILCLVIGVIFVIVLIPLLKIFLMHRSEQLVTMTASSAFAGVHLMASIFVLSVLTLYINFHIVRKQNDENLMSLASDINRTLTEEIRADIATLNLATADLKIHNKKRTDTSGKADSTSITKSLSTTADTTRKGPSVDTLFDVLVRKDRYVRLHHNGRRDTIKTKLRSSDSITRNLVHIYWTDSAGLQRIRWTKEKMVPQRININDRDYFKAVADNKLFYDDSLKYHFTDVSSWVSNNNFAVISVPVAIKVKQKDSTPLIMVSGGTRLKSLFNPILPTGYSFCILDASGKVLFHKETIRNLNENFLLECSNNDVIEPILTLRKPDFFESRYAGSNHRFFCKPLNGTPYSLLTFRDLQQGWAEDLDIVSATSILILFNLGIILMTILAIKAFSYSKGKRKTQNLALTWLRPSGGLRREYVSITCFFAIAMLIQMLMIYWLRRVDNLALIASTFLFTYLMLVATFHQFSMHRDPLKRIYQRPEKILIGLSSVLGICIFLYWNKHGNVALWLVVETILYLLIYMLFTYRWNQIALTARTVLEQTKTTWLKPGFRHSYTWFVWALITSTSIVPLLIFYMLCHEEQTKMSRRYAQWDFAKQLSALPARMLNDVKGRLETSYIQPFHHKLIATDVKPYTSVLQASDTSGLVTPSNTFERFYRAIKPSFLNHNRNLELLNSQDEKDPEYIWRYDAASGRPSLFFKQNFIAGDKTNYAGWQLSEPAKNSSKTYLLSLLNPWNILLVIALLTGLYFLLRLLVGKIFFNGAMEQSYSIDLETLTSETAGVKGNLFIYGPPGIQKLNAVKKEIQKHGTFVHIDFSDLSDHSAETLIRKTESDLRKISQHSTILLITNININADDAEITGKKLAVIEHFLKVKRRMFIISSKYFESLGMFGYNAGQPNELNYAARWEHLMKSFYIVYHRWHKKQSDRLLHKYAKVFGDLVKQPDNIFARASAGGSSARDSIHLPLPDGVGDHIHEEIYKLIKKIIEECGHSAFLSELTEPMIAYASKLASPEMHKILSDASWPANRIISRHFIFVFDKVCERIESLAQNHYLSVWNAVILEEQRTLYDISIDELVNPLNRKTAARLCEIGLVNPIDGLACYQIMNVSFRNYIQKHVANNEISLFKKEIAAKGFGSSIQLPLVIVAISAFVFIAFTQKEAFTNFISYLGAAFAGVTGLVKMISSIPASRAEGKA